ncbi:hypothetical protein AGMMS50267_17020 [Spirochaetia bacterium]|nr:hypothetical protein AGMMS50267_17020 [Spirochaetia bacterium]
MITKRIVENQNDEIIGDLLEFRALIAGPEGLDMMDIQRDIDIEIADTEETGVGIEEDVAENAFIHINQVLQTRSERVGEDNYPFSLSENGSRFTLKPELSNSGYIYLFCLLLSHPKEDEVLTGDYLPVISDSERRLFQSCSTVAAAGLIAGNAISFGFPRPDGSGFYDKLREVYRLIGDGEIRDNPIAGVSRDIKDYEIDIIAWLYRQDAAALERYFLAQVASGNNWAKKELSHDVIDRFHKFFFSIIPNKEYERGIFIPFLFDYEPRTSFDEQIKIYENIYGKFQYRFSIPRHFSKGFELSKSGELLNIDGVNDYEAIKLWVCNEIIKIQEMILT